MEFQHNNPYNKELLQLKNIHLDYGQLTALKNINLTLGYSEVHAIVGEHGAGKSSISMIISGLLKPKSGRIIFKDKEYAFLTLGKSLNLGIEIVYQQIYLHDYFTVAENLFLTNKKENKFGLNHEKRLLKTAKSFLSKYNFDINPSTPLKNLNLSDRTLVDILKHISVKPQILILDEALERLSSTTLNKIIDILIKLKNEGMSILFITHRINDIYNLADRVSIIKNGEILLTDYVNNINKINLIKIAYTQIGKEQNIENLNKVFYQLLKYNEAILQNLPVNLIVTDNENRIIMVNEYCKKYFQLENSPFLNLYFDHLFSDSNIEVLKLIKNALLSKKEKVFYHMPIIINNISTINNIKTLPIYDGTFVIGNIIIIEDVTEYDNLQKQFALSEKLASVGLLAAGVAHEINNPLEIIYNYLSYMKYNFKNKELHKTIDNLHEEISCISNIVNNLLTFSDVKKIINEEIEINDLIINIVNLIKNNARYKNIIIHFESSEEYITINANKNEIKQVILNLLKNSFEAMPSGGEISIKTLKIRENDNDFVKIIFKDNGLGIKDANPNNVFLPFYSTKKEQGSNLGLGLSVSYGIIKKYKGTISVKNIDGSGCLFTIKFPHFTENASIVS